MYPVRTTIGLGTAQARFVPALAGPAGDNDDFYKERAEFNRWRAARKWWEGNRGQMADARPPEKTATVKEAMELYPAVARAYDKLASLSATFNDPALADKGRQARERGKGTVVTYQDAKKAWEQWPAASEAFDREMTAALKRLGQRFVYKGHNIDPDVQGPAITYAVTAQDGTVLGTGSTVDEAKALVDRRIASAQEQEVQRLAVERSEAETQAMVERGVEETLRKRDAAEEASTSGQMKKYLPYMLMGGAALVLLMVMKKR
jgi:hypothetical protein